MATLQPPFQASGYMQLARKIQLGKFKSIDHSPRLQGTYSADLSKLVNAMLKVNPEQRPTIEQILYLPRVQIVTKRIMVERRYLQAKRLEQGIRQKEKKLKAWNNKLSQEQRRLQEEDRIMREKTL